MKPCCASCLVFSSVASDRWITCTVPAAERARANGGPTGRRSRPVLSPQSLPAIQTALREQQLDGWLLFDFQGLNPVARGMLGFEGLLSRRAFAMVPREGTPVAISHAIEQGPWKRWPAEWPRERYSSWRSLEQLVAKLVKGK